MIARTVLTYVALVIAAGIGVMLKAIVFLLKALFVLYHNTIPIGMLIVLYMVLTGRC